MPRARSIAVMGALLILAAAALPRRAAAKAERPPNVILVVIDTLRADRLGGSYGGLRGLTPFLDELADRGTVFTTTYAPSSWTCPSVASLLTSRYPSQHRVATFDAVLASTEVSLAESLAPLGYRGAGFTANFRLTADHGYAQGFGYWDAIFPPHPEVKAKVRGERVREDVTGWLSANRDLGTERPLFLYLQYLEPHAPYEPPEPFRSRFAPEAASREQTTALNAALTGFAPGRRGLRPHDLAVLSHLYDGEVASVDAEIRQLFDALGAAGVLNDAVIIITADHGEEFGAHGELLHGHTLYNDAIRVPLIIVAPGYPGAQVISEPVSLLDVAPTVLALAGGSPEPRHEGRSLLPLLRGTPPTTGESSPLLAELLPLGEGAEQPGQRLHSRAIIDGARKGLVGTTGALEVYDLAADPHERAPLPPLGAAESLDLLATLETMETTLAERAQSSSLAQPLDDATKEKLRALGYKF